MTYSSFSGHGHLVHLLEDGDSTNNKSPRVKKSSISINVRCLNVDLLNSSTLFLLKFKPLSNFDNVTVTLL